MCWTTRLLPVFAPWPLPSCKIAFKLAQNKHLCSSLSSERHLHGESMLVMISNVLCKYFASSTNSAVHLSCSIIVLAGEQTQRAEMSHVFSIHVKWRSYGLVRGQKNQRVSRRGEKKSGTVPRSVPGWWARCSNVSILDFNWLQLWFQISPQLICTVILRSAGLILDLCLAEQHLALLCCQRH